MVSEGMAEGDVLNLPLDKFFLYQEAANRRLIEQRKNTVIDTAASIGGAFSKDGVSKYLKLLDGVNHGR